MKILLLPPAVKVGCDRARVRRNPDVKITIVEFSDFQCPHCLQAYGMIRDILKKYDGNVRLEHF